MALLLIVAGALASALIVYRSGDRVEVLVAAKEILPGHVVTAGDFKVGRVAADGQEGIVPSSSIAGYVGTTATSRIPAETLINRNMFLAGGTIPVGSSVIGVVLTPQQRPSDPLESGDVVRAYLVAQADAALADGVPGQVLLGKVRVVAAATGGSGADSQTVSLLVPDALATKFIGPASLGQVALAVLPDETVPDSDLKVGSS